MVWHERRSNVYSAVRIDARETSEELVRCARDGGGGGALADTESGGMGDLRARKSALTEARCNVAGESTYMGEGQ